MSKKGVYGVFIGNSPMTVVCMTSIAMHALNTDSSLVILKPDE